jgi:hypothetical protein
MVRWKVRTETWQYAADSDLVRSCDEIAGGAATSMGRLCRAGIWGEDRTDGLHVARTSGGRSEGEVRTK